jgi:3-oxoadipate enol-lactonase
MKIQVPPRPTRKFEAASDSEMESIEELLGQLTPIRRETSSTESTSGWLGYGIARGFEVEYEDAGRGPIVVFLHAFPMDRRMWRSQIEAVTTVGYRAIAPDLRGWGGTSSFNGPPSIESMADDTAAFLDALKIQDKIVLCGLSMGGYTAQVFAHKYGERLRALVLADARAEADTDETKAKREEMILFAANHTIAEIADKQRPAVIGETTMAKRPGVVREWDEIALAQKPESVVNGTKALRDRADGRAWLSEIAVPTLLVFGDEDKMAPPEIIATLKNGIKNSKVEIIAGAGHMSNMEDAPAFNRALLAFLDALPKE